MPKPITLLDRIRRTLAARLWMPYAERARACQRRGIYLLVLARVLELRHARFGKTDDALRATRYRFGARAMFRQRDELLDKARALHPARK